MRWFRGEKPAEVWEEEIVWPLGDIEAAERIRRICQAAADSAENVGSFAAGLESKRKSDQKKHEVEAGRYERAARKAMEIAMKVSDDLMRDAAVSEIIELCLKARDLRTARVLLRAVQADWMRERILADHPALGE
jgi:hypothetical protein